MLLASTSSCSTHAQAFDDAPLLGCRHQVPHLELMRWRSHSQAVNARPRGVSRSAGPPLTGVVVSMIPSGPATSPGVPFIR
jgi:hypothetical protein